MLVLLGKLVYYKKCYFLGHNNGALVLYAIIGNFQGGLKK